MIGLTPRQRDCLRFIAACAPDMPSYDEIALALNLKAKSGVYRLVDGLVAKGRIFRTRRECARNIVIPDAVIHGRPYRYIPKTRAATSSPRGADKTGGALANCAPGRLFEGAR
jgi:SOS-response transcriptional repressor LexA